MERYKYSILRYNVLIIISFIIFSIISISILLHTHILFGGSDLQFHARRLLELKESFANFNFFPQFSFNEFHGAATMAMYPYINLVPITLLSFIIKSPILLIYLFFIINVLICFLISYFSSLRYSKSFIISYIFSLTYGMSTLYLDYGFSSMDFGVLSAATFLPLVIFGFINLIDHAEWEELTVGMTLILYSHILSVFIVTAILLIWLIININKLKRITILNLIKSVSIFILLTSIIWLPLIHIIFMNFGNISSPGRFNLYGTSFKSIVFGSMEGKVTYGISILAIIGLLLSIVFFKKLRIIDKQMLIISLVIIILCSKFIPWEYTNNGILKILSGFQFTWRFYIVPQLFLCYLFSQCVFMLYKHVKVPKIFLWCVIFIIVLFQLVSQNVIILNDSKGQFITKKYIYNHTIPVNINIHHKQLHNISLFTLPPSKNIKIPLPYKIRTKDSYKLMTSPYISKLRQFDYYPMSSFGSLKLINNNKAVYNNRNKISFMNNGYNRFIFKITNRCIKRNTLCLPLVCYRGEHFNIFLNHKLVPHHISAHNTIVINNVKNGYNKLYIRTYNNLVFIMTEYCMFVGGILWLLVDMKNKYKNLR